MKIFPHLDNQDSYKETNISRFTYNHVGFVFDPKEQSRRPDTTESRPPQFRNKALLSTTCTFADRLDVAMLEGYY